MLNLYNSGKTSSFEIPYSIFLQGHGKLIILELPTAEELAKHLPFLSSQDAHENVRL
jgi:hypothetical protein